MAIKYKTCSLRFGLKVYEAGKQQADDLGLSFNAYLAKLIIDATNNNKN